MKKNAGTLKLSMAQYRELESFAQFDSDLDPETKKAIERGKRVTELLKQPQYSPMNVASQVIAIFAVNNGYMDDVAIEEITKFEKELVEYVATTNKALLDEINKDWNDDIKAKLDKSIQDFKLTRE